MYETTPKRLQVGIRMQQGEHTGQPIYSNFTAVQSMQGVVLVDFGFLDPQAMQVVARKAQAGQQPPEAIVARMAYRMAVSIDAAANLNRQLTQLLPAKSANAFGAEQDADKI